MKLSILFLLISSTLLAQSHRSMEALRSSEKITIDGLLNEESWSKAKQTTDFTQFKPSPGNPSSNQTEVRFIYDDDALYIAAKCFEKLDNISTVLCQRDDFNPNVDNFQIILDTYNDDQNGFDFGVSSKGVQFDSKISATGENIDMNMVWSSAVSNFDQGWQLEMRIPYSAIRFPKVAVQNWGINFFRYSSHNREESTWNAVNPELDNWMVQCGEITNIEGILPPLRLAFMPYVSGYANHEQLNPTEKASWSNSMNGGMDIKLGLNEAFTLDMTLVPDFGQVVFDNKVLNLSPFEIQFNENRQFFTEGTELFTKSGLFYSRRIGVQSPYAVLSHNLKENEYLKNVPTNSQLYNATKISGRTKSGLGIGVFNAVTAAQNALAVNELTNEERTIEIAPTTNYNVFVLDQNLKNNSSITFTNTNVIRQGDFYDANVSGINGRFNNKSNNYFLAFNSSLSNKLETDHIYSGYNYGIHLGKQKGNLIYSTSYFEESNTYNPNDLGFNTNNNKRIINAGISYRIFKPFWKLNQLNNTISFSYNRLYNPDVYTSTYLNYALFANTKKFHAVGIEINGALTKIYDYFEPRVEGRFFVSPKWLNVGGWISTNYQKRFALDANIFYSIIDDPMWNEVYYKLAPRLRVNDKIFISYSFEVNNLSNALGYAVAFGTPAETVDGIVFGSRNQNNTINSINASYTLTNRMGITFRLRHYRTSVIYNSFSTLNENGTLQAIEFSGLDNKGISAYNTNYNAFTIDFVYRWVFLPGSEINIVWKNAIFNDDKNYYGNFGNNLKTLFDNVPMNSFSFKLIYWLDYQSIKRFKKK